MTRFLLRRITLGVMVMFFVTVIVFLIFYVGPGPGFVARALAGREALPSTVALISHRLLLNRPWYVQYWHFVVHLLHGKLGTTTTTASRSTRSSPRPSRSRCRS